MNMALMGYILIVVLGQSITAIEFHNGTACEKARAQIEAGLKNREHYTVCLSRY